jgi:hypothetical protein
MLSCIQYVMMLCDVVYGTVESACTSVTWISDDSYITGTIHHSTICFRVTVHHVVYSRVRLKNLPSSLKNIYHHYLS